MLPLCILCAIWLCLVNTALKFIFIFSDRKAGGSTVPPCLLGIRRGTRCIYQESGSGASCGVCGTEGRIRIETEDGGTRLKT